MQLKLILVLVFVLGGAYGLTTTDFSFQPQKEISELKAEAERAKAAEAKLASDLEEVRKQADPLFRAEAERRAREEAAAKAEAERRARPWYSFLKFW